MKQFGFWQYDKFPFVLGSLVDVSNVRVYSGQPAFYAEAYRSHMHTAFLEHVNVGHEKNEELKKLAAEYAAEYDELRNKYLKKALVLAPFLKSFPAYKDVK